MTAIESLESRSRVLLGGGPLATAARAIAARIEAL
jgi:hypothetical protein